MPDIHAQQIDDMVTTTLQDLGRGEIIQIAQNQIEYETYSRWFQKGRVTFSGGTGIQKTLMHKLPNAARFVGLYEVDEVGISNLLTSLNIYWAHGTTNWAYAIQEMLMNTGESRINDIIKPRRAGAVINLVEVIESKSWSCPTVANTSDPYGLPYWIVKNGTQGYNGALPSDHTTVAGVNLTTTPTFKNWTDTYTAVSKADLVTGMRKAVRRTRWKPPQNKDQFKSFGQKYSIYVNEDTLASIEAVGEAQNENLGRDIASMDDQIVFKKFPITWVEHLDADTTDPVYGVNHDTFYAVVLKGDFFRETGPNPSPKQHNLREVHMDISFNILCLDRRRNFVISKAA